MLNSEATQQFVTPGSWMPRSRLRMRLVVDGHQVRERDLGIFLRGGELRVAEQFLDGAQIGAVAQKVRGVGVAQAVRMNGRIARDHAGVEFHDAARAAIGEPAAAMIQKQSALAGCGGLPALLDSGPALPRLWWRTGPGALCGLCRARASSAR